MKRLLLDFYDVAETEVKLLRDSDHHPNVIRYYMKEQTDRYAAKCNVQVCIYCIGIITRLIIRRDRKTIEPRICRTEKTYSTKDDHV